MSFNKLDITLIICTKDRPKDLERLLISVGKQTILPKLVMIVDGSDHPIKDVLNKFPNLNFDYVAVRPPSLPKQRNVGISRLPEWSDWVGFLDDDLVLYPDSIEQVVNCATNFKTKKPIGGISMIIQNAGYPAFSFWRSIFLLDVKNGGAVTNSGSPTMLRNVDGTHESEWISGGVTFWRKQILQKFSFDEWFDGTGYLEDVDFSYRVSREYSLIYSGKAKCDHFHHPVPVKKIITLGVWQISSWWYFANKFKQFKKPVILWSMFGLALNNLGMGILNPKSYRFLKFLGNLKGFYRIFSGQALRRTNWQKEA